MITISIETIKMVLAMAYVAWVVVAYIVTSVLVGRYAHRLGRCGVGYGFLSFFLTPFTGFIILLIIGRKRPRYCY